MTEPKERLRVEIEGVLASTGASHWLKMALAAALERDCVDAANDAEYLAGLLGRRCDAILGRG